MFGQRVPFISQMEAAECGAACLGMVLGHFGHHTELVALRIACGVSRDGTSAAALMQAARSYGLEGKATRVEPHALVKGPRPAILHWGFNHFVVLRRASARGLEVLDPACGARLIPWSEVDRSFTGIRLSFRPGSGFRRRARRSSSARQYRKVLGAALPGLALLLGAALMLELAGLLFPVLSQVAIDFVVRPRQSRFLWILLALLVGASLLRFVLSLARHRVFVGLRVRLDWALRMDFIAHLVRLPLGFFSQRASGDLTERTAGHDEIRDVMQGLSSTALDALLVASYSLLMFAYDQRLALVVLAVTALRLVLVAVMQAHLRYVAASEVVATAGEAAAVDETFAFVESIQALGTQAHSARRHLNVLTNRLNATAERRLVEQRFLQFAPLLDSVTLAAIYLIGGMRVAANQMTLGVLAAFVAMASLFVRPLGALVDAVTRIPNLVATVRRIDDVWAALPQPGGGADPGRLQGGIHLRQVSFAYAAGGAPAVDDVSLDIAPGERVAFVGPSGCGKSTLAWLMAGMERPSAGVAYLDGWDVTLLDTERVRAQVGLVFADCQHFVGSVRDNLLLGRAHSQTEVERATRLACIHEELVALADGYDTQLDAAGGPLSGGQRQRLALARAVLAEPSVLILDEATSSVDFELESRILTQLRELRITQLIISHRPSAVRQADRVVVIEAGRIVAQGSFDELWLHCAAFREAMRPQTEHAL